MHADARDITELDGVVLTHRHVELTRATGAGGPLTLHVVTAGPEDGLPVVLLHGFPDFWYGWRAQIPVLARAGYRVIVPAGRRARRAQPVRVFARNPASRARSRTLGAARAGGAGERPPV